MKLMHSSHSTYGRGDPQREVALDLESSSSWVNMMFMHCHP
jgi:hypothetical protein